MLHRVGLSACQSQVHAGVVYVSKSNSLLLHLYNIFWLRQVGGDHALMLILSDPHGVLSQILPRANVQIIIRLEVLQQLRGEVLESLGFIDSLVVLFANVEEGISTDTLGAASLTNALIIWSDGTTFLSCVLDAPHGVKLPRAQA